MITVNYQAAGMIARLNALREQTEHPRAMMAAVGREGVNLLKSHFRGKDKTPNALGGTRQHFWLDVMRSVQQPVVDEAGKRVSITVSHAAFAQKVFGGEIHAKRVGLLTIPIDPESYGRTTDTFERETGLPLIFIRTSRNILLGTRAKGSKFFWARYLLTPSVNQGPDPTALPDEKAFSEALVARAESVLQREIQGAGGPIT